MGFKSTGRITKAELQKQLADLMIKNKRLAVSNEALERELECSLKSRAELIRVSEAQIQRLVQAHLRIQMLEARSPQPVDSTETPGRINWKELREAYDAADAAGKGYMTFKLSSIPGSTIPDICPFIAGTLLHKEWKRGQSMAHLDKLDGAE